MFVEELAVDIRPELVNKAAGATKLG